MNTKQLYYVTVLAREGNFSRAADELDITQPSLSQYIKKIEKELGVELFDRSGHDVRLTDAGKSYIEIGRRIQELEHQLEGEVSDLSTFKRGNISIGISAHRAATLMPPIVTAFSKQYPGMCLNIVERYRRDLIEAAERGEFDLCLTTCPVDNDIFHSETVFIEENVIALSEPYHLSAEIMEGRKFPVISASALKRLPFAVLNEEHPMQRELEALSKAFNFTINRKVVCTSLQALIEMVKEGIGGAFIPACLAKPYPNVNYYSIKEEIPKREIILIYRKKQYLSKAVLDLKDTIFDVLALL